MATIHSRSGSTIDERRNRSQYNQCSIKNEDKTRLEKKLGKTIYTFALYEKVKRASIALDQGNYSLLMVSFDVAADHESIILQDIAENKTAQSYSIGRSYEVSD